ncbi:o-succinylbenzoate synthase [Rathayibacter soli]|uniref:o-succinylbenzoate synthase n=1 Tax=Rathayibacter soli TaxID=3144168 RepID=UPI0027E5072F|nr:o-succinylbenzoate synthase [Glaciibacter superstes]
MTSPASLPDLSDVPDLSELLGTARVVALPMTTRFRGITVREALLVEGPAGWSEFSPFVEYTDAEAAAWLAATIDFGWTSVPPALRDRIPVNATVPAVAAAEVAGILARFPGCRTAKVKVADVAQGLADDVARVRAVRDVLGPDGRIRIDANGLWNVDEAEHAIHALAAFDLEYVEQPCATIDELVEIRKRTKYMGVPIAADESVRKASDPLAVARAGAADLLVIKAQPLGGIRSALRVIADAGLPAVISSALDTSVGLAMGAHLAAALIDLDYDCGLGTAALLAADVTPEPLRPVDGAIPVRRVEADEALLTQHAADADRRAWWIARLERCYRLLETARR